MPSSSRIRVYMACSFDGFIAGPQNDLAWLETDHSAPGDLQADPAALQFDAFMEQVGAMLMGRTTYDVIQGKGVWSYGETPVIVATRRELAPTEPTVRASAGTIEELIGEAKALAGDKDVYLDGGNLIRQALNAGLVDEIVATFVPVLLGEGVRLFDGLVSRASLQFESHTAFGGGLLQVSARIRKDA